MRKIIWEVNSLLGIQSWIKLHLGEIYHNNRTSKCAILYCSEVVFLINTFAIIARSEGRICMPSLYWPERDTSIQLNWNHFDSARRLFCFSFYTIGQALHSMFPTFFFSKPTFQRFLPSFFTLYNLKPNLEHKTGYCDLQRPKSDHWSVRTTVFLLPYTFVPDSQRKN